jgi:quercetin dioxygenase-like cupin family protein
MQQVKKNFSTPDETRPIKKGQVEILHLAPEVPVMRVTFQPGWKWSECVKPVAKTDSCQVPHLQYVVSGRIVIKMDDGSETEYGPGDLGYIPPGHDAWVVGNEAFVASDYQGGSLYAKPA